MFALHSRRLRRRLSAPNSGSARRRAREWERAERNRREGEAIARQRNELRQRQKLESQAQARLELETYEPWGRAGGGAPNPMGIRFTDIRAKGIYPEDELKGVQLYDNGRYWGSSPLRRRRIRQTPLRIREDPQCYYAENLRKSVENDIRYRQTPTQQRCYKEVLGRDDMVRTRQKALHDEMRRNLEFEQKMHQMEEPWGRPGPGGTTWRNPRNIGLNFAKSMGWTDQEIFNKMERERRRQPRSSLTLPQVKRDDDDFYDDYIDEKENVHFELPAITDNNSSNYGRRDIEDNGVEEYRERIKELNPVKISNGKEKRSPKKKFPKRLPYRDDVQLTYPKDLYEKLPKRDESLKKGEPKTPTPEDVILRTTGGIELVPLLARRRRVGARTLPSSDVTRPPEQQCQWREKIDAEHLAILKHQMRAKCLQKEESRQNSAESVRRHHETWASLWGRPGHGAPQQRGRYARSNLAELLYVKPLEHLKHDQDAVKRLYNDS